MMLNLNKIKNDKRGSMLDAIFVPIYILLTAVTAFIGLYVWINFQSAFNEVVNTPVNGINQTYMNETVMGAALGVGEGLATIDYMFPMMVVGLLLISLVFAFKTGSSVVYVVISLILWAFAMVISVILENIFAQFVTSFPGVAAQYTMMTYIVSNMKWLVLVWLFLLTIVMFTRNRSEDRSILAAEGNPYG